MALALIFVAGAICAQDQQAPPPPLKNQRPQPAPAGKEVDPPEEDISVKPTEYSFNPLQAERELKVGNDYLKRGKLRAAEGRFREATKWNENYGEAWLRLGEVEERLKDSKAAREAYTKYLAVAAEAKNAIDIRKKLEKLK